ncbi:hypothetical protein GDO81_001166 [Engystomops pustulosus]|uniref:Peroxisomal membrane protein 11C n=1 Tax=Engystomops pustulosus TaxID=76066 RepID=A0AAV7DAC6_ENGPU|nr:hypothetical protein GDO81_001166 [Engystomops pustulosus]
MSDKWWDRQHSSLGSFTLVGIIRSLRTFIKLRRSKGKHSADDPPKSRGEIKFQMRSEVLCIISCLSDLVNAIHWMPTGFLWGGSSPTWLVGLMGTISSMIGIYQTAAGGSSAGV